MHSHAYKEGYFFSVLRTCLSVWFLLNTCYFRISHIIHHAGKEQVLKGQNLTVQPFTYKTRSSVKGTSKCLSHPSLSVHAPSHTGCSSSMQHLDGYCKEGHWKILPVYRVNNSIQLHRSKGNEILRSFR